MKKSLAGALAVILFLNNVAFLNAAEKTVWSQRRAAVQRPVPEQFAALPQSVSVNQDPLQILHQMPGVARAFGDIVSSDVTTGPAKLPSEAARLVKDLPLDAGQVKEVYAAPAAQNSSAPLVVLIQDVHLNLEAQKNIAKIITAFNDGAAARSASLLIGIEGAFGPFDFSPFRLFNDPAIVLMVSDWFLEENRFSAPAYAGINAPTLVTKFVGIDDPEHYAANLGAYRSSQKLKQGVQSQLFQLKQQLAAEKRRVFGPTLMTFDAKRDNYLKGSEGLGAYVSYLARLDDSLTHSDQDAAIDFTIEKFLTAYRLETSLNFARVEQERARVVEKLAARLGKPELDDLVAHGLSYQMGRTTFAGYYTFIKSLIDRHGIDLRATPAFDTYIQYVLLSDQIQGDELLKSVRRLEDRMSDALCRTPEEKKLLEQSRRIQLEERLIEFALTPDEWNEYKQLSAFSSQPSVDKLISTKTDSGKLMADGLSSFERFYREADVRSAKMIENLQAAMTTSDRSAVLVVGGFHTPYLTALLKQKGFSYAVVQPRITKIDSPSGTEYLSIFTREKTPLEKLFEGQKLFLAPSEIALFGAQRPSDNATRINEILFPALEHAAKELRENPSVSFVDVKAGDIVDAIKVVRDGMPAPDGYTELDRGTFPFRIFVKNLGDRERNRVTRILLAVLPVVSIFVLAVALYGVYSLPALQAETFNYFVKGAIGVLAIGALTGEPSFKGKALAWLDQNLNINRGQKSALRVVAPKEAEPNAASLKKWMHAVLMTTEWGKNLRTLTQMGSKEEAADDLAIFIAELALSHASITDPITEAIKIVEIIAPTWLSVKQAGDITPEVFVQFFLNYSAADALNRLKALEEMLKVEDQRTNLASSSSWVRVLPPEEAPVAELEKNWLAIVEADAKVFFPDNESDVAQAKEFVLQSVADAAAFFAKNSTNPLRLAKFRELLLRFYLNRHLAWYGGKRIKQSARRIAGKWRDREHRPLSDEATAKTPEDMTRIVKASIDKHPYANHDDYETLMSQVETILRDRKAGPSFINWRNRAVESKKSFDEFRDFCLDLLVVIQIVRTMEGNRPDLDKDIWASIAANLKNANPLASSQDLKNFYRDLFTPIFEKSQNTEILAAINQGHTPAAIADILAPIFSRRGADREQQVQSQLGRWAAPYTFGVEPGASLDDLHNEGELTLPSTYVIGRFILILVVPLAVTFIAAMLIQGIPLLPAATGTGLVAKMSGTIAHVIGSAAFVSKGAAFQALVWGFATLIFLMNESVQRRVTQFIVAGFVEAPYTPRAEWFLKQHPDDGFQPQRRRGIRLINIAVGIGLTAGLLLSIYFDGYGLNMLSAGDVVGNALVSAWIASAVTHDVWNFFNPHASLVVGSVAKARLIKNIENNPILTQSMRDMYAELVRHKLNEFNEKNMRPIVEGITKSEWGKKLAERSNLTQEELTSILFTFIILMRVEDTVIASAGTAAEKFALLWNKQKAAGATDIQKALKPFETDKFKREKTLLEAIDTAIADFDNPPPAPVIPIAELVVPKPTETAPTKLTDATPVPASTVPVQPQPAILDSIPNPAPGATVAKKSEPVAANANPRKHATLPADLTDPEQASTILEPWRAILTPDAEILFGADNKKVVDAMVSAALYRLDEGQTGLGTIRSFLGNYTTADEKLKYFRSQLLWEYLKMDHPGWFGDDALKKAEALAQAWGELEETGEANKEIPRISRSLLSPTDVTTTVRENIAGRGATLHPKYEELDQSLDVRWKPKSKSKPPDPEVQMRAILREARDTVYVNDMPFSEFRTLLLRLNQLVVLAANFGLSDVAIVEVVDIRKTQRELFAVGAQLRNGARSDFYNDALKMLLAKSSNDRVKKLIEQGKMNKIMPRIATLLSGDDFSDPSAKVHAMFEAEMPKDTQHPDRVLVSWASGNDHFSGSVRKAPQMPPLVIDAAESESEPALARLFAVGNIDEYVYPDLPTSDDEVFILSGGEGTYSRAEAEHARRVNSYRECYGFAQTAGLKLATYNALFPLLFDADVADHRREGSETTLDKIKELLTEFSKSKWYPEWHTIESYLQSLGKGNRTAVFAEMVQFSTYEKLLKTEFEEDHGRVINSVRRRASEITEQLMGSRAGEFTRKDQREKLIADFVELSELAEKWNVSQTKLQGNFSSIYRLATGGSAQQSFNLLKRMVPTMNQDWFINKVIEARSAGADIDETRRQKLESDIRRIVDDPEWKQEELAGLTQEVIRYLDGNGSRAPAASLHGNYAFILLAAANSSQLIKIGLALFLVGVFVFYHRQAIGNFSSGLLRKLASLRNAEKLVQSLPLATLERAAQHASFALVQDLGLGMQIKDWHQLVESDMKRQGFDSSIFPKHLPMDNTIYQVFDSAGFRPLPEDVLSLVSRYIYLEYGIFHLSEEKEETDDAQRLIAAMVLAGANETTRAEHVLRNTEIIQPKDLYGLTIKYFEMHNSDLDDFIFKQKELFSSLSSKLRSRYENAAALLDKNNNLALEVELTTLTGGERRLIIALTPVLEASEAELAESIKKAVDVLIIAHEPPVDMADYVERYFRSRRLDDSRFSRRRGDVNRALRESEASNKNKVEKKFFDRDEQRKRYTRNSVVSQLGDRKLLAKLAAMVSRQRDDEERRRREENPWGPWSDSKQVDSFEIAGIRVKVWIKDEKINVEPVGGKKFTKDLTDEPLQIKIGSTDSDDVRIPGYGVGEEAHEEISDLQATLQMQLSRQGNKLRFFLSSFDRATYAGSAVGSMHATRLVNLESERFLKQPAKRDFPSNSDNATSVPENYSFLALAGVNSSQQFQVGPALVLAGAFIFYHRQTIANFFSNLPQKLASLWIDVKLAWTLLLNGFWPTRTEWNQLRQAARFREQKIEFDELKTSIVNGLLQTPSLAIGDVKKSHNVPFLANAVAMANLLKTADRRALEDELRSADPELPYTLNLIDASQNVEEKIKAAESTLAQKVDGKPMLTMNVFILPDKSLADKYNKDYAGRDEFAFKSADEMRIFDPKSLGDKRWSRINLFLSRQSAWDETTRQELLAHLTATRISLEAFLLLEDATNTVAHVSLDAMMRADQFRDLMTKICA